MRGGARRAHRGVTEMGGSSQGPCSPARPARCSETTLQRGEEGVPAPRRVGSGLSGTEAVLRSPRGPGNPQPRGSQSRNQVGCLIQMIQEPGTPSLPPAPPAPHGPGARPPEEELCLLGKRPGEEAHEAKSCLVGKKEVFPPSQGLPEGEAETGGGGWLPGMPTGVSASRTRLQFELQTEIL